MLAVNRPASGKQSCALFPSPHFLPTRPQPRRRRSQPAHLVPQRPRPAPRTKYPARTVGARQSRQRIECVVPPKKSLTRSRPLPARRSPWAAKSCGSPDLPCRTGRPSPTLPPRCARKSYCPPRHSFSHSFSSGNFHTSFGRRKPALVAGTTISKPISPPSSEGNSSPSSGLLILHESK